MEHKEFIPLMIPEVQQNDIDAVVSVLNTGMFVQGPRVEEFENKVASYLGIKHAIAVSNGTASLHLALMALGIGPGDEVIVPAFSYIATANVVEIIGAKPVFVDIDIETFNIDITKIEYAISGRTKAIMPVHEFGLSCNIEAVCQIAQRNNLLVIEDAACALGAKENNLFASTLGKVGSFSFHPRKAITSGEGGLIVTNDDLLAKKFKMLRNHGISNNNGKTEFELAGLNYRMTDFQAALLNSQFLRLENILDYKNNLATLYNQHLCKNKNISIPYVPINKKHTWQSYHIILDDAIDRDRLIAMLKDKNIGTNYGAQCIPFQKYYQKKYKLNCEKLYPNAMGAYKKGLVLPLYGKLKISDVEYIAEALNDLTK